MKKKNFITIIVIAAISCLFCACGGGGTETEEPRGEQPLNISIFLDLSDRVIRDNVMPDQKGRDLAIVECVADFFKSKTMGPKILESNNRMKVFFYPAPSNPNICHLAEKLEIEMSELKGIEKRDKIDSLAYNFKSTLNEIYDMTITERNWVGSDIWDFFSTNKVDKQCIKEGYRNIVIILTDGYIYSVNNKIKEGTAYSYILPQTLDVPNSSLIVKRKGLQDLEVLMLEVNPYTPKHRDKMVSTLKTWFRNMEVKRFEVAETDISTNVKTIVKDFLSK